MCSTAVNTITIVPTGGELHIVKYVYIEYVGILFKHVFNLFNLRCIGALSRQKQVFGINWKKPFKKDTEPVVIHYCPNASCGKYVFQGTHYPTVRRKLNK